MTAGLSVVTAALLGLASATAQPIEAVRARPRPELPWVVAVLALDVDANADQAAQASDPKRTQIRALLDAGGAFAARIVDQRVLFVAEGPPEAHDLVVQAAASARELVAGARGVLFVDGRTALTSSGPLPPRRTRQQAAPLSSTKAAGVFSSPLAPDPALLDVEGAALAELIEDGLVALGPVQIEIAAAREAASLRIAITADRALVKKALEDLVAKPLTPARLESLRVRAAGRIAERRAAAGGWALDMARRYVGFGTLDVDLPTGEVSDLGARLRARIFPERLAR